LQRRGVAYGRARVAVDSSGGISTCRYCGKCLDGCPYGSIFNPRLHFKQLELDGITIHKGWYALEFQEGPAEVAVTAVNVHDGSLRTFHAGRLFVGMGAISSTRFLARSLKLVDIPIPIQDSQYFFFPVLAYRKATDITVRFSLADIFVDILNRVVSPHYVHLQIYGLNEIFRQTLQSMLPVHLRRPWLLNTIESRFYLFQGFLHSSESGHLELTVTSSHADRDEIHVRGVTNPASLHTAKRTKALVRSLLAGFGVVPPLQLTIVAPGRSFHAGGSFPMGKKNTVYASDLLGRPAGLHRTHVVDASIFPSIPATTIAYTAMANSDRVVNETYRNGYL
jgi:ferredoxin